MRRPLVIAWVLLRTAARGLQTSPLPSALASATIAIALVMVGAFSLALGNMDGLIRRFSEELHVVVYLEPELPESRHRELLVAVGALDGVHSAVLVGKEEALARFEATLGGPELLAGLDHNPLPASLEIELRPEARTEEGIAAVAAAVQALDGVDDLAQGHDWVEGYARITAVARTLGVALGTVLVGAALLIVANTIRLAIYAREDELEILSLVGAGRIFQRGPFILEGLAEGLIGGLVALGLLWAAFQLLLPQFERGLSLVVGGVRPEFFGPQQAMALVVIGALLGGAGSGVALIGWRR